MKSTLTFLLFLGIALPFAISQDYFTKLTLLPQYQQTQTYENKSSVVFNGDIIVAGQGSVPFVSNLLLVNKVNNDGTFSTLLEIPEHRFALEPTLVNNKQLLLCGVENHALWLRVYDEDYQLVSQQNYSTTLDYQPPYLNQIVVLEDHYALIGTISNYDSVNKKMNTEGFIYWINKSDFSLESTSYYRWDASNYVGGSTWFYEATVNENNELAIFCHYTFPSGAVHQGILLINENQEVLQELPAVASIPEAADMILLNTGNYIHENTAPNGAQSLRCSAPNGNALWEYTFPSTSNETFVVNELAEAKNGDIIGCGAYENIGIPQGTAYRTGYIFRFAADGELKWAHEILEPKPDSEEVYTTQFSSLVEDENGDICWLGSAKPIGFNQFSTQHEKFHWFAKTDANGCLSRYDCFENPTNTAEIKNTSTAFKLVGNLVNTTLSVQWTGAINPESTHFFITNVAGQKVRTYAPTSALPTQLSVADLPSGLYFLSLEKNGAIYQTERFVKE